MSNEDIQEITDRLRKLPRDEQECALWQAIGQAQYAATHRPRARLGEFFSFIEANVRREEEKLLAA
jgi:hypothetical protein